MILDLDKFIAKEQPYWDELSALLRNYDESGDYQPPLEEAKRFYYLYQRTSADLVKLNTFAGEVETTRYLERIVAKAYSRLHESGAGKVRFRPLHWLTRTFPATFRRHWRAFVISAGTFLVGASLGAGALAVDYDRKNQFIPPQFPHLREKPSKRVEREEKQDFDAFQGRHAFSSQLMTHNTKVTALAMVSGFLWGIFTLAIMFDNGKLLGLVSYDYLLDGQGEFLTAWLLPHGSVEIPAILLGGQAGLVIAHTMFGWGTNLRLHQRFARIRGDLLTLIAGAALMLIWAAIVESFLSQYHAPDFYPWKIGFGALQLTGLIVYLTLSGRKIPQPGLAT
ncbi:MAG: stage II sporulation protein M [Verrucomicrobiales bacterium]|nr:stage II sporulation protein M [Verrucomicrobiales bacterium]